MYTTSSAEKEETPAVSHRLPPTHSRPSGKQLSQKKPQISHKCVHNVAFFSQNCVDKSAQFHCCLHQVFCWTKKVIIEAKYAHIFARYEGINAREPTLK